jgi:hypothetical protein
LLAGIVAGVNAAAAFATLREHPTSNIEEPTPKDKPPAAVEKSKSQSPNTK